VKGRITPDTTTAMADKLPLLLAPFADFRGSVDSLTNEFNTALSAAIDSAAPLVVKKLGRDGVEQTGSLFRCLC